MTQTIVWISKIVKQMSTKLCPLTQFSVKLRFLTHYKSCTFEISHTNTLCQDKFFMFLSFSRNTYDWAINQLFKKIANYLPLKWGYCSTEILLFSKPWTFFHIFLTDIKLDVFFYKIHQTICQVSRVYLTPTPSKGWFSAKKSTFLDIFGEFELRDQPSLGVGVW